MFMNYRRYGMTQPDTWAKLPLPDMTPYMSALITVHHEAIRHIQIDLTWWG